LITPNSELSEDLLKQSLIDARGDLFIAATTLRISPLRMQRLIQAAPVLSVALSAILDAPEESKSHPAFSQIVEQAIAERVSAYRVVGLDSLYELATMPISENSANNQVKLGAAANLVGSTANNVGGNEMADTLRALNEAYNISAPRIRITRERLTVDMSTQENVIDQSKLPS
jgi:hypothetical protein